MQHPFDKIDDDDCAVSELCSINIILDKPFQSYANSRRVFNHVAMLEIQEENSGDEDEIGQLFQQGFRGVRDGLCCLAAMGPAGNDGVAAA
nr:hypothetical protein Iba_chr06bCG8500 [Ipomoea batatas]